MFDRILSQLVHQYLTDNFVKKNSSMTFSNKRILFIYRNLLVELNDIPEYSLGQFHYDFLLSHLEGSSYVTVDFKKNERHHISHFICKGRYPEVYHPKLSMHTKDWTILKSLLKECGDYKESKLDPNAKSLTPTNDAIVKKRYNRILLRYDWCLTSGEIFNRFRNCSDRIIHAYHKGYTNITLELKSGYNDNINFQLDNGIVPEVWCIHNSDTWTKLNVYILAHQIKSIKKTERANEIIEGVIIGIVVLLIIILSIKYLL